MRSVLTIEARVMHSQPEISDIAAESDDGVPRRASHTKKEDVPGAICSVVGAAESHLAIVLCGIPPLHKPERGMPTAKTDNKRPGATCVRNSLRALDGRDPRDSGACAAPDFMRQVWGEDGALLRALRSIGRLCLTYAVCNDTALVSAYFARSLRAFACPLRSGTGCAPDNGGRAKAVV